MAWSIFQQGGGNGSAVTWARDFLRQLGAPRSPGNVQFVYDWEHSEGGGGAYNPLNQGPVPGQPSLTTSGSQYGGGAADYAGWGAGLTGAVDYLNMPNYATVRGALMANNPTLARDALFQSPWAGSHYGYGADWSTSPLPGAANALPPPSGGAGGQGATLTAVDTSSTFWQNFADSLPGGPLIRNAVGGILGSGNALSSGEKAVTMFGLLFTAEPWVRALEVGVGGLLALGSVAGLAAIIAKPALGPVGSALEADPETALPGALLKTFGSSGHKRSSAGQSAATAIRRRSTANRAAEASRARQDAADRREQLRQRRRAEDASDRAEWDRIFASEKNYRTKVRDRGRASGDLDSHGRIRHHSYDPRRPKTPADTSSSAGWESEW